MIDACRNNNVRCTREMLKQLLPTLLTRQPNTGNPKYVHSSRESHADGGKVEKKRK